MIAFNLILLQLMYKYSIKDAFKISFSFIFFFIGFIQFVIALIAKQEFQNNFSIILLAALVLIQLTLFVLSSKFKNK